MISILLVLKAGSLIYHPQGRIDTKSSIPWPMFTPSSNLHVMLIIGFEDDQGTFA